MAGVDVRRLAAIDLHGARGTMRRRRIVLAEFTAGAALATALGAWIMAGSAGAGGLVLGIWIAGCGLNYAVLTAFAVALSRPGALDHELAGVDTARELRRYSLLQLWLFVPLSLPVLAILGAGRRLT
jgi:hypothetical protein